MNKKRNCENMCDKEKYLEEYEYNENNKEDFKDKECNLEEDFIVGYLQY
ncbi:MAG: hypothetical protein PHX04_05940 [Bacilli bacterium]|nr:hypothetical protein [Bacilli bacterium]